MRGESIAFSDRVRAVLQLNAVRGLEMSLLCAVFDRLAATGLNVDDLLSCPVNELVDRFGLTPQQATAFQGADGLVRGEAVRVHAEDLQLLTRAEVSWPRNLLCDSARLATPWLFMHGDPNILSRPAIGIAGSRDATARSLHIARLLATDGVREGRVIVSGGAHGIDAAAHNAALAAGGQTIVVLAQGIGTFRPPREWKEAISDGQMLLVSEFLPMDVWEAPRAIRRNATIVQLSEAFVVVQAGAPSGTLSAGQSAIRMRWPLYVVRQSGKGAEEFPGNDILLRRGGMPLDLPSEQSIPRHIIEQVITPPAAASSPPTQLGLFS